MNDSLFNENDIQKIKINDRIISDCEMLKEYFNKLFALLKESETPPVSYPKISHFIKPDMLINIYSLLEFWLKEICTTHKKIRNMTLSYNEIKGKNDLNSYHKYLTRYLNLDLGEVQSSYGQLDNLRKVRNHFIHSGGHISENSKKVKDHFSNINHITVGDLSLIYIEADFIWESLLHTEKYLITALGSNNETK